jgi:hypothetical protein
MMEDGGLPLHAKESIVRLIGGWLSASMETVAAVKSICRRLESEIPKPAT